MTATATAMLNVCRSQLSFREGPDNDSKYGDWFGLPHQPYCAMGLSWCAATAGALDIMHGRWASCPRWMEAFRQAGQLLAWNAPVQPGDIAFFDWTGRHDYPDHVGIVESEDSGQLLTIEFNTEPGDGGSQSDGGGCYRRRRQRLYVAGIARPVYARQEDPAPAPRSSGRPPIPLVLDGVWGPRTTARLQIWLGLPATGTIDLATRQKLQARLGVDADGVWGRVTRRALQKMLHVTPDGIWGPVTVTALQRFLNRAVI